MRWGLFGRGGNGADSFWRFVRESALHGADERIFQIDVSVWIIPSVGMR